MTQTVADRAEDRRLRRFIQLRELRQTVNDAARRAHAQARLDTRCATQVRSPVITNRAEAGRAPLASAGSASRHHQLPTTIPRDNKQEVPMPTTITVNLPVKDLAKSTAFFTNLGFAIHPMFAEEKDMELLVISDAFSVMLNSESRKGH
jgi:hypothetical protein